MKKIIGIILVVGGILDLVMFYFINYGIGWLDWFFGGPNFVTIYGAYFLIGFGSFLYKKG
jgi:hypothetical protein